MLTKCANLNLMRDLTIYDIMKKVFTLGLICFLLVACHKDDEDMEGNLLGAWQVGRCIASVYDADGNLQSTYDEGFSFTYMDYNDEGWLDQYVFNVSSGDKWVFIDDSTVHIKDKLFAYHHINLDGESYIRLDAPNLKYRVVSLTKSSLKLKYLEINEGNNTLKEEITFNKL